MEDRLAALEQRVERLEARQAPGPPITATSALELLRHLQGRAEEGAGAVAYAGAAFLGGGEYMWAGEHDLTDLMAADWAAAAPVLESMGSPPRLALLAALVGGPRSRAELQEALGGETSSGHLYHHLRELQNAGLIGQQGRGTYAVVPRAVIPLLAILAAALDLGRPAGTEYS
ncbi:helix-turn-helix domain-containing protein [Nonomuraea endophytica]|uniref:DNA-binding transcriptional ArsR family regulator n=1 Tax=Nonomuraea endophytica TaxID=714136 RepID=A0A7W8AEI6_9ACTN|nr:helix-turn-helix domain-containing protein [Nonomuraea endophytica]MBB5084727.1 DNA-binding transcriptional ArsR family regulator [Nonomuraea endophytica]